MSLLVPDIILNSVFDVSADLLNKKKIKGLILDVDNTLAAHGDPNPLQGIDDWLLSLKSSGISAMILSNNTKERISPFAKKLDLDFISMGCKPFTHGLTKACKKFNLTPSNTAIVGDQIFTDILAGNLKGIYTILVSPVKSENNTFFKFKRFFEKPFINKYYNIKGADQH